MSRNQKVIMFLLFLLVLFCLRIPWLQLTSSDRNVDAVQGEVNISNWSIEKTPSLYLDGEWEFYPGELWTPDDIRIKENSVEKGFVTIPSTLRNEEWDSPIGTYRLQINMGEQHLHTLYQLLLPVKSDIYKVFINDELMFENEQHKLVQKMSGLYGQNRMVPISVAEDQRVDIVIQVSSNLSDGTKGFEKSIKFGTSSTIKKGWITSVVSQMIVSLLLFIHFIYSVLLFLLRYKAKEFLYFGLIGFFASFATLLDDDKLLLFLLPLDYATSLKMVYIAYIGIALFTLLFCIQLVQMTEKKMVYYTKYLYLLFAIILLFVPYQWIKYISVIIFMCIACTFLLSAYYLYRGLEKNNPSFYILALSSISLTASTLWGLFKSKSLVELPYYPWEILIALFGFSLYLFYYIFSISDENREMSEQLQEELNRKDEFLAITAHELKNPLHGIVNMTHSILQSKDSYTEEIKNNLQIVQQIGIQMSKTIDNLLDLSVLKDKGILLKKEVVDISTLINTVIDMVHIKTIERPIRVEVKLPKDIPFVFVDKNYMVQILYNVIHNAMKFTHEGSIIITVKEENEACVICIKDTGIGIEETMLHRIFQPYESGDIRATSIGGGIGLGLYITKMLIEEHGGNVVIQSEQNKGTTVTLTVPVANELHTVESERMQLQESEPLFVATGDYLQQEESVQLKEEFLTFVPKILIVDDDVVNLKVLRNILPENRYDLTMVTSGREAIELVQREEWDLLISDVMMPKMSGYNVTKQVRMKYQFFELPVLLLTARNRPEDIHAGFYAGANDYVTKPVDSLELKTRVNVLVNMKKSIHDHRYMEAAWLQAQIQPHFLFNTINTIVALSGTDTDKLIDLLEHFGHYLRRSFDPKNIERLISIEDELELVKSYLFIEQTRFGEKLKIEWDIQSERDIAVPPLSIQTIVENAISHGVMKRLKGGTVKIGVYNQQDGVEIVIEDDGVGGDQTYFDSLLGGNQKKSHGVGLINTNSRLLQIFGIGLTIRSEKDIGTKVQFYIPIP